MPIPRKSWGIGRYELRRDCPVHLADYDYRGADGGLHYQVRRYLDTRKPAGKGKVFRLRTNVGIGACCGHREDLESLDGLQTGEADCKSGLLLAYCQEEREEYMQYSERGMPNAGPVGELAYFTIRQAVPPYQGLRGARDVDALRMASIVYVDFLVPFQFNSIG